MNRSLDKINSQIANHLSPMIQQRYPDKLFSIVRIDTFADLSISNIYISELNDDDAFINRINKDAKTIRFIIAKKLKLRKTPEFRFYLDDSESNYARIEALINKIN